LVKTIGLLFKIPLHDYLGDEGMGYFNAAYTIYTWFYMISTAGLPIAMSVLVSKSRAKGNFNQVKKILRLSLWLFFIVGSVGMLILALGSGMFAALIKVERANLCILAIAPTLFFVCLTSAYRGYFQGHQIMWPTAVSQMIESVGKLVLGITVCLLVDFARRPALCHRSVHHLRHHHRCFLRHGPAFSESPLACRRRETTMRSTRLASDMTDEDSVTGIAMTTSSLSSVFVRHHHRCFLRHGLHLDYQAALQHRCGQRRVCAARQLHLPSPKVRLPAGGGKPP